MMTEIYRETMAAVAEFVEANGYPPTVRDVADALHLSSTSMAHKRLTRLVRDGYLRRKPGASRGIIIVKMPEDTEPESAT